MDQFCTELFPPAKGTVDETSILKKGENSSRTMGCPLVTISCWRLLRVPWTARTSNQSILKEISPEYSLRDWCWSWNANTLATWFEELTHLKRLWCWERLKAGGEGGDRGWDGWMASPTRWTWVWVNPGSWWWTGRPGMLQSMGSQSPTRLSDWTEWLTDGRSYTWR